MSPFLRSAVVLGLLCASGPLAIDMFLPAMPAIADSLGGTIAGAQLTISAYFIAFGLAQMVYGPLADVVGRKPPLIAGLVLFLAGSVGCALAPDMNSLVAARVVQALGGAAAMVIPRAIIRDMHTGPQATRLMALVMLIISVSPMLAPLIGSGIVAISGWRAIFGVLALVSLMSIAITWLLQPETLAPERRAPVRLAALISGIKTLLRDPVFMGLTFVGAFGMASFFVFLASSSFVYTGYYGLTPTGFSLAFAANAAGFFSASQLAARLGEKYGSERVVSRAVAGFLGFTLVLLGLVWFGVDHFVLLVALLICANACLGLVIPTAMVMALDDHGDIAGLASSLGGMLQMMVGGIMTILAGPFFDGTPLPMVAAIALAAVLSFVAMRITDTARGRRAVVAA
ncbi:DHA1 family bicyclomycin/chloramphenicol resistance-like MFS transporter [Hoeflea halophila]|uniref:Bcr/CflA family efflux transporter n=1 Tax=Hoeflea halophila TaxID=714899 RepID=A0A286IFZ8_9HYPH|nr:multidrug effflux MFS transporter [Hoeflea halophila]SOE18556.1 DHA1 family bicyclomycin/chloramphenicol resistance-like MFS transporter [Hoeflea halophila]